MPTVAVPDLTTWTDVVDGPWTSHGAGITVFDGRPKFKFETFNALTGATVNDLSDTLQSFAFRRGVREWWRGTKAATARFVFDESAGKNTLMNPSNISPIRLSVDVGAGYVNIFSGRPTVASHTLVADRYAQLVVTATDRVGFWSGTTIAAATPGTSAFAADEIRTLLTAYTTDTVAMMAGITAGQGGQVFQDYTASNLMDNINQILRGELGVLWQDPNDVWQFRQRDWWYPTPATAVAALGPVTPTAPPDSYTYHVPAKTTKSVADQLIRKNKVVWSGAFGGSPYTKSTGATPSRTYNDTVKVWLAAFAQSGADALQLAYRYSGGNNRIPDRVRSVKFPADVSNASLQYAAAAEITDYVNVNMASLEGAWQEWVQCWVMGISHEWSPQTGWWVTLDVDDTVPDYEIESAG